MAVVPPDSPVLAMSEGKGIVADSLAHIIGGGYSAAASLGLKGVAEGCIVS